MRLNKKQEQEILAFDKAKRGVNERGKPFRKCLRYNYILPDSCKDPKKRDVTLLHVAVRLNDAYKPCVKVVASARLSDGKGMKIVMRDMGCHLVAGWVVYWDKEDWERKAINAWIAPAEHGEWFEHPYGYGKGAGFPFHPTVNESILAETRYRYCGYESGHGIGLLDWLVLYRENPRVEFLGKAKLWSLVSPAGLKAFGDKKFFEFVRDHVAEIAGNKYEVPVREIIWAQKHGKTVAEAHDHYWFAHELMNLLPRHFQNVGEKVRNLKLDYERVRKTMPKWGVDHREYARYLHEAKACGLDLSCEGVLYPPVRDGRKTFMDRLENLEREHDKITRREKREAAKRAREQRKIEAAESAKRLAAEKAYMKKVMPERIRELEAFQRSVDRVMKLNIGNGITCVVAKTQEELKKEGRRMGNCVGYGIYGRGVVNGNTIILQFRDKNGHSWCDAEIDRSQWTIRQCYARHNEKAPAKIEAVSKVIAETLKKQHKANVRAGRYAILNKKKVAA